MQNLAKQVSVGEEAQPVCSGHQGFGWRLSRRQPKRRAVAVTLEYSRTIPADHLLWQPTNLSSSQLAALLKASNP